MMHQGNDAPDWIQLHLNDVLYRVACCGISQVQKRVPVAACVGG